MPKHCVQLYIMLLSCCILMYFMLCISHVVDYLYGYQAAWYQAARYQLPMIVCVFSTLSFKADSN